MTAPEPAGRGQIRAIANALNVAHMNSDEVAHVNAHATGTSIGDQAEAAAIHSVFGLQAMVAAPKGSIGHLVGAAGAVEAIITARTIEAGVVPHTINLENPDVGVELDFVMGSPRETPVPAALSNSFGFGGQNVTLLLRRM
ncbi:hypothetical protein [Leifsonia poae]|uniref:hypothetical protein n=1 Tax=Leifsonia poae TaxID=110933 RepID=UPI003D67FE36